MFLGYLLKYLEQFLSSIIIRRLTFIFKYIYTHIRFDLHDTKKKQKNNFNYRLQN